MRPTTRTAASATAQQASYTHFGQGCSNGEPPFAVVGLPRIGGSFVVRTFASCHGLCLDGGIETWVLTGFSNTRFGAVALPFDLSSFGPRFCGPLLTSIEVMDWTPRQPGPSGLAEVVFRVPNDQALVGLSFYQQVFTSPRHTVGVRVPTCRDPNDDDEPKEPGKDHDE